MKERKTAKHAGQPLKEELKLLRDEIAHLYQVEEILVKKQERLELAQQVGRIATFDWDLQGTHHSAWTPELERLYGMQEGDFKNSYERWKASLHPEDQERADKEVRAAVKKKRDLDCEFRVVWPDGSIHWLAAKGKTFFDKDGKPSRLVGVNIDITERKEAEEAQAFLAEASQVLSSSLDYETTLITVANLAVPRFSEWCGIDILQEDGTLKRLAVAHQDSEKINLAKELAEKYPSKPNESGIYTVIRNGELFVMNNIAPELVEKTAKDEEHLRLLKAVGFYSMLILPMVAHGKTLGTITFVQSHPPKEFTEKEIAIAKALGDRAALAIENSQLYKAAQQEIAERKRAEETIRHRALHDALTDLPNRVLLQDRLTIGMHHAKRNKELVALLFLDLDAFKYVNDTLGHQGGDLLLKEVAGRLASCVREEDTIARFGGDEFLIMLTNLGHIEDVRKVIRKIFKVLTPEFAIDKWEIHVGVSIGVALYPSDGTDAETLIKNADTALYRAKDAGRNTYQFYRPATDLMGGSRLQIETDLHEAISKHQLELYYQPIVDVKSGSIIEAEALLRWNHPQHGLILPNDFIPLAEELGIIHAMGEWALEKVFHQLEEWRALGLPPLTVSVNFSASQFSQPTLLEKIEALLAHAKVSPHQLKIEITESVAMQNMNIHVPKLQLLKEMGVQIAVDDFGTGYSSLSYLKRLPIDQLKIDKSFIQNSITDPGDAAIVKAIIAMAHTLRLRVIAEGVENEEQLNFLASVDCNAVQGYLISQPLPVEYFTPLFSDTLNVQDLKRNSALRRAVK